MVKIYFKSVLHVHECNLFTMFSNTLHGVATIMFATSTSMLFLSYSWMSECVCVSCRRLLQCNSKYKKKMGRTSWEILGATSFWILHDRLSTPARSFWFHFTKDMWRHLAQPINCFRPLEGKDKQGLIVSRYTLPWTVSSKKVGRAILRAFGHA